MPDSVPRPFLRHGSVVSSVLALIGGGLALATPVAAVAASDSSMVFINELHYDNDGTDTGEFVEVAGPAGTDLSGAIVVTWIGCYLAQLAMIYVIGHVVGHTRAWWFFVASLLPWVVDWGSPVSLGIGLLVIAVAVSVFMQLRGRERTDRSPRRRKENADV